MASITRGYQAIMKRLITLTVLVFLVMPSLASEEEIEYRQDVMSAIGSTMGGIGKILKGEVDQPSNLPLLANALGELAQITGDLFPEGSEGGDALPAIWEEPEDFNQAVAALQEAAAAFREAAASENPMQAAGGAIRNVGRSCKGCHDNYRD